MATPAAALPPTEDPPSAAGPPAAALLADLLSLEPEHLVDAEVGDGLLALATLRSQVDARLAELAAEFDGRLLHTADATRSTASWLGARSELTPTDTRAIVERGRTLRSCPHVAAAHRAGILGTAKVRSLLRARDRVEDLFAEHEEQLVELIAPLVPAAANVALAHWRRLACATAGVEEDPEPFDEESNQLHLSRTLGGRYKLDGNLDQVTGAKLEACLEAEVDRAFRAGEAQRDDGRTHSQRRAAAFTRVTDRGAMEGTRHGEPRPSVHLIWDVADLLGLPADTPAEALRRRCQLPDGTPVPRSVAERLLARATVRDILAVYGMDGSCQVLGVSDRRRLPTARQRIALEHEQRGCTVSPGCDQPARWTEGHHLDPFATSQQTELARMALACRHDHHAVHDGGFTLTTDEQGRTVLLRPDGSLLPPTPVGHQVHEPTAADLRGQPTVDPPDRADLGPGRRRRAAPPPGPNGSRPPISGHDDRPPAGPDAGPTAPPPDGQAPGDRTADERADIGSLPLPHQRFTVTRLGAPNPMPSRTPSRFRTLAEQRTLAERRRSEAGVRQRQLVAELLAGLHRQPDHAAG